MSDSEDELPPGGQPVQPTCSTAVPAKGGRRSGCQQSEVVQARILELARGGASLRRIDRILHDGRFLNKGGKRWGMKTDQKVAIRLLRDHEVPIPPDSEDEESEDEDDQEVVVEATVVDPDETEAAGDEIEEEEEGKVHEEGALAAAAAGEADGEEATGATRSTAIQRNENANPQAVVGKRKRSRTNLNFDKLQQAQMQQEPHGPAQKRLARRSSGPLESKPADKLAASKPVVAKQPKRESVGGRRVAAPKASVEEVLALKLVHEASGTALRLDSTSSFKLVTQEVPRFAYARLRDACGLSLDAHCSHCPLIPPPHPPDPCLPGGAGATNRASVHPPHNARRRRRREGSSYLPTGIISCPIPCPSHVPSRPKSKQRARRCSNSLPYYRACEGCLVPTLLHWSRHTLHIVSVHVHRSKPQPAAIPTLLLPLGAGHLDLK